MDRLADADPNSVFTRAFLPLLRADLPLLDEIKLSQERVLAGDFSNCLSVKLGPQV